MTPVVEFTNGFRMPVVAARRDGRAVHLLLPDAPDADDADRDGCVWRTWHADQIRVIDQRPIRRTVR